MEENQIPDRNQRIPIGDPKPLPFSDEQLLTSYIRRLERYQEVVAEGAETNLKRADYLIIVLAGAFIYYAIDKESEPLNNWAISLLVTTIIANFISQWTGWKSCSQREIWVREEIALHEGRKSYDEMSHSKSDSSADKYQTWTSRLNLLCGATLVIGIILLMCARI